MNCSWHRAPMQRRLALAAALMLICVGATAADSPTGIHERARTLGDFQALASNGGVVVAVGANTLLRSTDEGHNWTTEDFPKSALIDISACPDRSFIALDFYHRVWIGDEQARNWKASALPDDVRPMALTCGLSGDWWVVGDYSNVLRSTDRGATWTRSTFGEDAILTRIQFIDAKHGIISGEFGILALTNDGGSSWRQLPRVPGEFYPFDAWFDNEQVGWLTGRGGKILSTRDGGLSWQEEPTQVTAPMYGFVHAPAGLFAVGELGLVEQRNAHGVWRLVKGVQLGGYLRAGLFLADHAELLVVGGSGAATPAVISVGGNR